MCTALFMWRFELHSKSSVLVLALVVGALGVFAEPVKTYEGVVAIPTYDFAGRETEPPLFGISTVAGKYPFVRFIRPLTDKPAPRTYKAIFVENEYLKLTYLPDFGGRFFSLYDKIRNREVFYRNDVIKPAGYNDKDSFPLVGIELTGPYDTHMLTLYGEPYWSHRLVRHADGSVSLVLGSIDPVYHMKVDFAATLYPGLAAVRMSVFCFNRRDARMPQMFWISASVSAKEKMRFIYPMTRTIGHTTSEVADWPVYNGVDYSWDRNNKHMLGVFGIDIYDNFQGAYDFGSDYGVFRYADRRVVTGMKMWTFGYSPTATNLERAYTDNAGPYIEVQSGRHVWDGHYEWVGPHKFEHWYEWWFPVSGIGGLTTTSRDVALNLEVNAGNGDGPSEVKVALSANREMPGAHIVVKARSGELLNTVVDLSPARPFVKELRGIGGGAEGLREMSVRVVDGSGRGVLNYRHPDENPGRKEYTPFTAPLEKPAKDPSRMNAEELVLAAEYKFKELKDGAAVDLLRQALKQDAGYSKAHLLLGIHAFRTGRYGEAAREFKQVIERDPYQDEAYYYLAQAQLRTGEVEQAERNLYYIAPLSGYWANREYLLGRLEFLRGEWGKAAEHLEEAVRVNGYELEGRLMLALLDREQGRLGDAERRLGEIEELDPTSAWVAAERYFLKPEEQMRQALVDVLGGQSQEALDVTLFYRGLRRWKEALEILRLVEADNHDVWGTPAEFYYTVAYCLNRLGRVAESAQYLKKAQAAARHIDRFPYREESEEVFAEAVARNPQDHVARFYLGCLLYHMGRAQEAIQQWEAAVAAAPGDFSARRALGLAYAEQGEAVEKAAAQLEKAVEINPAHTRTLNDLSNLYARESRFTEQIALLQRTLERSPGDDALVESLITGYIITGHYEEAEKLISSHRFNPRHRTYALRDAYRMLRYAMGTVAFRKADYPEALKQFRAALNPPVSLGVDNFQFESTPRVDYYIGRTLEAMGRTTEARAAYEKSSRGYTQLTGDWDSLNPEALYMALSLEKLGKQEARAKLMATLEAFAQTQLDARNRYRQVNSRYLLALLKKYRGQKEEADQLLREALKLQPESIALRLELRGDLIGKP